MSNLKAKLITAGYAICVVILVWIILSTVEVWLHNASENKPEYSRINVYSLMTVKTETMTVVYCTSHKADDTFEVTVEDADGNRWAYYDSEFQYAGTKMEITMEDNAVIDAKVFSD